jgi:pre-mRNA cleavage complex 2 protein Pcf11
MKYSQHLDWHFRQNRRDRDNTRKAQSRKWYYDVSDWIQFEEIEDLEERGTVFFTYLVGLFEDEINIFRSSDEVGLLRSA